MNNVLSFPIEGLETCAFEESAHLLKLTLRAAGAGTWALDLRTGESVWSDEIFPLLGVTREHCVPSYDSWLALVHPEDRDRARQCIDAALQDRTPFEVEFRNVHPDGTIHWLKSKGNAVYSRGGTPVRMVGITFDVTQRKATEERLRFREQQLAAIADGVPVLISYVDADQRYQFNNRLYEQWFGIARGELIGKRVREVVGKPPIAVCCRTSSVRCPAPR
jgi:PAS domain S-box-containing protein